MRFLCDVHISYKLVKHLENSGFAAIHINTILDKWFTKDKDITTYADINDFIIITKDADFRDSHLLKKQPKKLIKINLGNTSNNRLIELLDELLPKMSTINHHEVFLVELDESGFYLTA
jgi:predicted nuclease of predicted toxin-antitoxin system